MDSNLQTYLADWMDTFQDGRWSCRDAQSGYFSSIDVHGHKLMDEDTNALFQLLYMMLCSGAKRMESYYGEIRRASKL
jgi:hypothetical protein